TAGMAFEYLARNELGVFTDKMSQMLNELSSGNLQALASIEGANGHLPIFTGAGTMATLPLSSLSSGAVERVETLAERAAYDDEEERFAVLVADADDGIPPRAALY